MDINTVLTGGRRIASADGQTRCRNINLSSVHSAIIKTAGRICDTYASDILIDFEFLDKDMNDKCENLGYEKITINRLLGYRKNGVDHKEIMLNRDRKEYHTIHRLDITITKDATLVELFEVE